LQRGVAEGWEVERMATEQRVLAACKLGTPFFLPLALLKLYHKYLTQRLRLTKIKGIPIFT